MFPFVTIRSCYEIIYEKNFDAIFYIFPLNFMNLEIIGNSIVNSIYCKKIFFK